MNVDLSKLPIDIQKQIPMSLRSYSNVHVLEELPVTIQYLIKGYFEKTLNVNYKISFDLKPDISKYSDFASFDNLTDLIVEYLKNYLLIVPETYPFDPYFGSRLKNQIQTRDTNLRQTLISSEIDNIIKVVATEINANITVEKVELVPISMGASTEYTASIHLRINNEQKKVVSIEFLG